MSGRGRSRALAIGSVRPEPDRLTIDPVAGRELEVLTVLLPYYDGRPGQMGNFLRRAWAAAATRRPGQ
jgi:hypothetical protein